MSDDSLPPSLAHDIGTEIGKELTEKREKGKKYLYPNYFSKPASLGLRTVV
jgi:hypothetical protein